MALALSAGAGWMVFTEPEPPADFNEAGRLQNVEFGLDTKSPVELWELYFKIYKPMAKQGMKQLDSPQKIAIEEAIRVNHWYRDTLLIGAASIAALSVLAFAVLPREA